MSTLAKIHMFLKHYFGDALALFLDMLYGGRGTKNDAEAASSDSVEAASPPGHTDGARTVAPTSEGTQTEFPAPPASNEKPIENCHSSTVAATARLPSLPSILTKPSSRPPLAAPAAPHRQDFGRPSTAFHDRRLPLRTITTNTTTTTTSTDIDTTTHRPHKRKAPPKNAGIVNWSLPTRTRKRRRPRAASANGTGAFEMVSAVDAPPAIPSSRNKPPPLAQARHDPASRRASAPPSAIVSICVPSYITPRTKPTSVSNRRRHSTPPLPSAAEPPPPPGLRVDALLRGLMLEAEDTLAGLGSGGGACVSRGDGETKPDFVLVSSISAARSLAELAHASSRSLSDLLAALDGVLAGPRWRRVLARAEGIAPNDSLV